MEFDDIKKECKKIERHFIAQEAERDTLLALLIEQETTLKNLETQKDNNKKGLIFLRTKAAETRTNALAAIEEIIGAGIQNIYGHDYKFTLEDIPLFWKPFISYIDVNPKADLTALRYDRDRHYLDVMYAKHASHHGKFEGLNPVMFD